MKGNKTDISVYADWLGMPGPKCIGILSAHQAKGRKAFGFEYSPDWLASKEQLMLDPDIGWYSGPQFPDQKENFGIFLDSMPDTWGRTLMKRRASLLAREAGKQAPALYDIDFLLAVYDESRMGALRFKLTPDGPFLDDNKDQPIPHWSHIKALQHAASMIESGEDKDIKKWLGVLMAPGSSLGGARPKANVLDNKGHPWIAKFPSRSDVIDKAAWEFLVYKLACRAGVIMSESKLEKIASRRNTFFTKRFDRKDGKRIHFASAMTMTGNDENIIRDAPASYLDIAEFIQFSGADNTRDLHQLWRRIVFNIAVSNTDDHLRNHGFILSDKGWRLSPAFDINPSTDKEGLALNIDTTDNALSFELAMEVGKYFQLDKSSMDKIFAEVRIAVKSWKTMAEKLAITKVEQGLMEPAFRL